MRTPLETVITRLDAINELALQEADEHRRWYSKESGEALSEAELVAMLKEPSPAHAALLGYLGALPMRYLRALNALMYSGRDGDSDMAGKWQSMSTALARQDDMMEAIIETSARMDYIRAGMRFVSSAAALNALPEFFS